MTALSADYEENRQDGDIIYYLIKEEEDIYKGAITTTNNDNGYLYAATDTAGYTFAGIAVERSLSADVTTDSDGKRGVRLFRNGVFQLPCSGATQAWVGHEVFVVDDNTVALRQTVTNGVLAGTVVGYISSTKIKVDINATTNLAWTEESWSSSSSSSCSSSESSSCSSSSSSSESSSSSCSSSESSSSSSESSSSSCSSSESSSSSSLSSSSSSCSSG